jgi:hypothetical protein
LSGNNRGQPYNLLVFLLVSAFALAFDTNTRLKNMPLTDTAIRNAKPGPKPVKLSDGGGLHLLIQPHGAKLWRLAYRHAGKQKTLAFGIYPTVSLAEARSRRDAAIAPPRLWARGNDRAWVPRYGCHASK